MPVFAIVGTKGGTGKSTVAMGLAVWFTKLRLNDRILLIDEDMHVREHCGRAERFRNWRGSEPG